MNRTKQGPHAETVAIDDRSKVQSTQALKGDDSNTLYTSARLSRSFLFKQQCLFNIKSDQSWMMSDWQHYVDFMYFLARNARMMRRGNRRYEVKVKRKVNTNRPKVVKR